VRLTPAPPEANDAQQSTLEALLPFVGTAALTGTGLSSYAGQFFGV
jgi:hypothetical protein